MNKTELVEKIAAGAGLSKVDAKKALDAAVVPTAALLPGKSHGRRSLVGCRPWGR